MKKNKRLIILILFLLILIIIALLDNKEFQSIIKNFQSISKNSDLKIEANLHVSEIPYHTINPQKAMMLLDDENNKQDATGRYANITPDKAIDWRTFDNFTDRKSTITAFEMFKKITLDGNKITLPTSIKDLGDEYSEFEDVEYSKITKDMLCVRINNQKNNVDFFISYIDKLGKLDELDEFLDLYLYPIIGKSNEIPYKIKTAFPIVITILKDNENYLEAQMDTQDKSITDLRSNDLYILNGTADIRVDGIGIGNTFNEMYAKFGMPSYVSQSSDTTVIYRFTDALENGYVVEFTHDKNTTIDGKQVYTKPNIITQIHIFFYKKD